MDFNALQDTLQGPRNAGSSNGSLESKYELLAEIGRGSYGVVWKARRRQGGQLFAVKQICRHRAGDKGMREVMGEVETMSLLSHPNIVRLEETFQEAEYLWIVMEYLPGGELLQVVKAREMQEAVARRVVTQLLMAVEYIHDKGIVHRDLKPANCLITEGDDMVVKISDFGFAVLAGAEQCLSTYCGTVAFMAPEILRELNYGKPVDMWALGVMTFYMVTGEYPFTGATTAALRRAVCHGRCNLNAGRLPLFPLLRDFLAHLFLRDPHRRMTAKDALKHPWIKVGREYHPGSPVGHLTSASLSSGGGGAAGANHLPPARHLSGGGGRAEQQQQPRRARVPAAIRWRAAALAVVAAHRLLYLQRCRRLAKLGFGQLRLLRDYHYSVTGRFAPGTEALDCSRAFARTPQALLELLPMVQTCRTLAALDLSHNGIDSLSLVQALLKACGTHPSLRSLSLAHNPVPAVAGRGLLRLARNPASQITSLDLTGTHIPEDTVAQIRIALHEKTVTAAHAFSVASTPSLVSGGSRSTVFDVSSSTFTLPPTMPRKRATLSHHSSASNAPQDSPPTTIGTDRRRPFHSPRLPPLPVSAVARRVDK